MRILSCEMRTQMTPIDSHLAERNETEMKCLLIEATYFSLQRRKADWLVSEIWYVAFKCFTCAFEESNFLKANPL